MERSDREFFNCDCHTEGVILDSDDIGGVKEVFLTFWTYGQSGKVLSLKERIRWCYNILKSGLPWADGVCLCPEEAKKLAEAILKRV